MIRNSQLAWRYSAPLAWNQTGVDKLVMNPE